MKQFTFVESQPFAEKADQWLSDEEKRKLCNELIKNPYAGSVISGTGGVRKLRFACKKKGKGKSGSLRIFYYFLVIKDTIYLLSMIEKSVQENLTTTQKKSLYDFTKITKKNAEE